MHGGSHPITIIQNFQRDFGICMALMVMLEEAGAVRMVAMVLITGVTKSLKTLSTYPSGLHVTLCDKYRQEGTSVQGGMHGGDTRIQEVAQEWSQVQVA